LQLLFLNSRQFIGVAILDSSQGGRVAYGAHIGGFIAGLLLVKFFAIGRR